MTTVTGIAKHAARALTGALLVLAVIDLGHGHVPALAVCQARAAEDWEVRFENACSRTQDAMALTDEELRALITSCDELKPTVAALDESRRKVYGKRLQLCRDLYEFVLQSREKR